MPIILSRDAEGNGFNFLDSYGVEAYRGDPYEVELIDQETIEELRQEALEDDEEFVDDYSLALVLWP